MNLIEVASIGAVMEAKNGRPYVTVSFRDIQKTIMVGKREVTVLSARANRVRNLFGAGEQKLDDGSVAKFKADSLFLEFTSLDKEGKLVVNEKAAVGAYVEGKLVTAQTTEFDIDGRKVTQWSGVVFAGEVAENYIAKQLPEGTAILAIDGVPVEHVAVDAAANLMPHESYQTA